MATLANPRYVAETYGFWFERVIRHGRLRDVAHALHNVVYARTRSGIRAPS